MMILPELVTPPAALPVTLEQAKQHCRVEPGVTDDDALIRDYIAAATDQVQRDLGYYPIDQVWRQAFGGFACASIWQRPVAEIVSIAYVDPAGVSQPLAADQYRMVQRPAGIVLEASSSWPTIAARGDAVTVTYRLGAAAAPPSLATAILLQVGFLYASRESVGDAALQPTGAYEFHTRPFRRVIV